MTHGRARVSRPGIVVKNTVLVTSLLARLLLSHRLFLLSRFAFKT